MPYAIESPAAGWTVDIRQDPYFDVDYTIFWPYHPNFAAEFEIDQCRQCFSISVVQFLCDCCSYLRAEAPDIVCCCSLSASRFNVLCICRCSSIYLRCIELLLPFYHFELVCPFFSEVFHQQGISAYRITAHWIFFLFLTVLYNPQSWLQIKIPADQQFLK